MRDKSELIKFLYEAKEYYHTTMSPKYRKKFELKLKYFDLFFEHLEFGTSLEVIARRIDVSPSTVLNGVKWCEQYINDYITLKAKGRL